MNPRVSVVINNCNYGRYLAQAVNSVLEQDFDRSQVEIIVVDDGSTDSSREVLAGFSGKVRAIFQDNQGQAGALNAGFKAAQGEFVCLLDSDDWWRGDKLRKVMARFEEDPSLGMVQHWTQEVDLDNRPLATELREIPARYTLEDFMAGGCFFTGTTGLSFRRRSVERVLPIPERLRICADAHLYYIIFSAAVGNISETLGFRRVHGANRFAARFHDPLRLERHLEALRVLHEELDKRLAERKLALPDRTRRGMLVEELTETCFLLRHRRRFKDAALCWLNTVRELPPERRLFKSAALFLGLLSPRLYIRVQELYFSR